MDDRAGDDPAAASGRQGARSTFDPVAAWSDGVITPAEVARFVADFGFELVHRDRPARPAGANLIVALRATPTLRHFDPEKIAYWSAEGGRGVRREIDRGSEQPRLPVAWGTVTVSDRLAVSNAFFTFGGTIRIGDVDPTTRILVLGSSAPIMRAGGHSQAKDVRADEAGAFFARLRAVVSGDAGAEAGAVATPPVVLYAAHIADVRARIERNRQLGEARPGLDAWSLEEQHRLEAAEPTTMAAGRALLDALGIAPD